ncbi:MAG: apolipoprotein N-acyltransferase [Rhodothermales bacterium]
MKQTSKENKRRGNQEATISTVYVLLGGLALGLSYPPFPFPFLSWVALVPLFLLWDRVESIWRFLAEIYTAFLIAYAIAFFWPLLHTFLRDHPFSETALLSFGALLLTPLALSIPFAASLPFLRKKGRPVGLMVFILFYLAVEFGMRHGPLDFPWPVLGTTQGGLVPLIQFAEYTGVAGLSLWVLLLNAFLFGLFAASRRKERISAALAIIVLMSMTIGFGHLRRRGVEQHARYLTVGLVQPAMTSSAWTESFGVPRIRHLITLSDSLIDAMNAPPIFMIWPEMAIPPSSNITRQLSMEEQIQAWTERRQTALLTGVLTPDHTQHRADSYYNRAVLYRPEAGIQHYDQVRSLPFNPSVPLSEQAPWMVSTARTRFIPGTMQHTLSYDDMHVGVLLGYEITSGNYARNYPVKKADFLAALSLDGWWGRIPVYRQHLSFLRLRAIETRRSVIQVTASSGTALIAPDGSLMYKAPPHEQTAQLVAVPTIDGITLYARFGDWIGWTALILAGILAVWTLLSGGWQSLLEPPPSETKEIEEEMLLHNKLLPLART